MSIYSAIFIDRLLDIIFPISVSFNERLKATITADNQQKILQYIMKSISDDKADNVAIEDREITYKGSTSNGRGSLFGSVDNGTFNLIYKEHNWWLNYQINMLELFFVTAIMSSVLGVFMLVNGGPWWVGIVGFLWLFVESFQKKILKTAFPVRRGT